MVMGSVAELRSRQSKSPGWPLGTRVPMSSPVHTLAASLAVAFVAAVPQLVPKRFLGNANGLTQMSNGFANLLVPLVAAGLLATIGLGRILLLDVASYVFALAVRALPGDRPVGAQEPVLDRRVDAAGGSLPP